ncbi:dynein regulator [Brachionus plicatilis]|uniref:Dynein regulator n=1 Tax=Brachionus plicatilis TaxID=10195 RepID=A0A3M7RHH9_BRAPC|nr:dynein regulator [Brachionus plicatilis]
MNQIKCDYCGLELLKNSFLMLPCGYLVCSEHISDIVQSKWCIVCQSHELDIDKFMSMAMNKMVLNESKLKQKTLELNSSYSLLRSIRTDPQSYMSGHFQNLKNQLDLRRSELKQEITRQIDDHYDHLVGDLQENQEKYLKKIESKLKNAELEDIHTEHEYRQEFNIKDRLDFIENKLIDLEKKIKNNNLLKFDLDQYKLFGFSKGTFDIEKIFGQFSMEKLANVKKYECVNSVHVHSNQVFCIDELESGEIVTSSKDKTIKIWDMYTGNCLNTLFGHTNWVLQFIILNRNEIISCSGDGSIRKWNLKSGDCLRAIKKYGHYC